MNHARFIAIAGKGAATLLVGAGTVAISLLVAGYVVALCAGSVRGIGAAILFGGAALGVCAAFGFFLVRVAWPWRAVIGIALIAGSFLLLPRPTCAAEQQSNVEC
jgi:hypothetical protein